MLKGLKVHGSIYRARVQNESERQRTSTFTRTLAQPGAPASLPQNEKAK
jgi:hypothetical protein